MQYAPNKRVVVIHWKNTGHIQFEIFSNLKNLCQHYPEFNYNTVNNYLSKAKKPYENDDVRIERKTVMTPSNPPATFKKLVPVVRKTTLKEVGNSLADLDYWLTQPASQRIAAVTFLISQSLRPGERMNKQLINKQPLR